MDWRNRLGVATRSQWEHRTAWNFGLLVIGVVSGATPALLVKVNAEALPAVLSLLGVIVGGTIAAVVSIIVAQATRSAQVVATTWPRRFDVHQAAFEMWWRVLNVIYDDDKRNAVLEEAQDWWSKNCLYLSQHTSEEFKRLIVRAGQHASLVENKTRTREAASLVEKNWTNILSVGPMIVKDAGGHLSEDFINEIAPRSE